MAARLTWLVVFVFGMVCAAPVARADPLCDLSSWSLHDDHIEPPVGPFGIGDKPRLVLEVEVEGPTTSGEPCSLLTRVIASFQGTVDSGYVWVDGLCGYSAAVAPGARLIVPGIPIRDDALEPRAPTAVVALGLVQRRPFYTVGPDHVEYFDNRVRIGTRRLVACLALEGFAYGCPESDWPTGSSPWYGMDREVLRQWAWNDGAGRDGARIPGAEPPDGVPAKVDAIAGGVWPSWWFAAEVYNDVVRLELTHGETVDPLGHDGCRAFGSILSVSRGARTPGDRVALRVPPAQCLFVLDLDAPVTWVALLEPTDDPRSDAAVVELLPLEPMVTWASSGAWAWSEVFHLERPDCPRAAAADDFDRKYPNGPL